MTFSWRIIFKALYDQIAYTKRFCVLNLFENTAFAHKQFAPTREFKKYLWRQNRLHALYNFIVKFIFVKKKLPIKYTINFL